MLSQMLDLIRPSGRSAQASGYEPEYVLNNLETAILVIDANGRILQANRCWKELSRGNLENVNSMRPR